MTTIRALMLAQQARHKPNDRFDVYNQPLPTARCDCGESWPCAERRAADAALATLDAAEKTRRGWIDMGGFDEYRLVPDPGVS